jgi:hypothetical protein
MNRNDEPQDDGMKGDQSREAKVDTTCRRLAPRVVKRRLPGYLCDFAATQEERSRKTSKGNRTCNQSDRVAVSHLCRTS